MIAENRRIAILTPYSSADGRGGVEVFNSQLHVALGEVDIISHPERSATSTALGLGFIGMEQPYRAFRVANSFMRRHRADPYQLVVSNGLCGWPLTPGSLEIPIVQVYHFTMAGLAKALASRGDRFATRTVSAFFDRLAGRGKHVVAVSDSVQEELEGSYGIRSQVIPNAVDIDLFKPQDRGEAREALRLPTDATIGLFVGRAHYAKGFDVLLEVAEAMEDILFLLVGSSGGDSPRLRTFELVLHSQMPLFYAASDFLFLPSRYEGMNLSILEALACDRPIVTTRAAYSFRGDPSRYGFVTERPDPAEFIRGIGEVLRRSPFSTREAIVSRYSYRTFCDSWRRLVESLLREDERA